MIDAPPGLVCLGVVTGAKGLKGEVRIKTFTADPLDVVSYGPVRDESGTRSFTLRITGEAKGQVLARVEGVTDRTAAQALQGLRLFVTRDALPAPEEEEFYHADLLGLRVEQADGTVLGAVTAIHDFGAGTMLEVRPRHGNTVMVPFTRAVVPVVDVTGGRVVVEPPPGLLDGSETDDETGEPEQP